MARFCNLLYFSLFFIILEMEK